MIPSLIITTLLLTVAGTAVQKNLKAFKRLSLEQRKQNFLDDDSVVMVTTLLIIVDAVLMRMTGISVFMLVIAIVLRVAWGIG